MAGLFVLMATVALAAAGGWVWRARSGRLRRGGPATGGWAMAGHRRSGADRVLLLQLSSPVCAPCRQTATLLADLTARRPGVVHREIDVADRPDVARELKVMRTPTVVAFDRAGTELVRVSGVPRGGELEAVVAAELRAS